ncbi:unnamed protein product [Blepharisma stoltei]|uniref:TNFR-Cys domain-containing protein n=1 Tax=Blepharisma stoltei TaxID=1481888 RepID=A0AAU9K986_9CILI|nr:unnamed protein product [Blepharisma stoltei]
MNFSGWSHLAYTVFYANSTTSLKVFLNNEVFFERDFPNLLFRDISNSTLFIGKSPNSKFYGFIYNFKMWNFAKQAFIYEFKNEVCGYGKNGTCLPLCSIDEYYQEWEGSEPSCEKCLRSCDKGCIRKDTCNICQDVLCAVCPYFGRTRCSQCIPYAYGIEKCKCIENYCLSLDRLSCIKFPYENSPEKYWIHFLPNTTIIVGKWSDDFVINTIHPWMIDVHLLDSDVVTFSNKACTFNPFYENFTCSFNVLVDPSYDNKNGPITIKAKFQGYVYPMTFPVSYDDFSVSLMSRPERLGVVFYAGYNYIQIMPDEELSFNDDLCSDENCTHVACDELLSQKSISSIGSNIDCAYSGPGIISIYVGHIKDNINSLVFREKVFYGSGKNETNLKYLTVPWKLQKPPLPVASIVPLAETCCSCNAIFDGSRSSTRLGSLKYQWILNEFMLYSGDETERIANITLQSCNIAEDHKQFNVTLIVTDNFDQQASASMTVNMTSDDVLIRGWKDPKIKTIINDISKLIFEYQKSSIIHLEPNPMVIWSLFKKSPTRGLLGSKIYESTGVEFDYIFTQKGEYIIVLDAYFNNNTYKISANASIIANPPVPDLALSGVNTYVFANSNITVNLTASYKGEVFELDKGYAFINKIECSNGEFIEIEGDIFKLRVFNKERIFNCSFTVGLRDYPEYESEVSWLYVVKGNIPRVYIVSMFPYLDPSAPVRLIADVADSLRMIISWREKNGHPFIATTPTDQPSMTIQEFSMLCGLEYEFEITVIDPVSFVPVKASIKRYVNCPPNSGTFEVDPKEGRALDTQFNVLFAGWNDLEGDDPISYQVFMQKDENMIALTPKTTENKFKIVLGERGKVTLVGRIYDSRGTFTEVEVQADVNDSGFVDAKERSEILLSSGMETMDSNMLFSSIHSIAHYTFHNTLNLNDMTKCIENLEETLNKWMNSSMPRIGLSESSTVIDAVSTLLGKAEVYKEKLLLDIYSTQNKALNHTKTLDVGTYTSILSNLDKLLDSLQALSAQNESAYTEMDLFKIINQTHSEGTRKYLGAINPNESPVKYRGGKFNSTSILADGKSLAKPIEYDSPIEGSATKFNVNTSKNSDSTSYLVSILSVAPFKNISDALLSSASSSLASFEDYSFTEGSVVSSDSAVIKKYSYSDELTSWWVQPSLSKNTGTIINPVLSSGPVTEVSSEVSYETVNSSLEPTCTVYDLNIEKSLFKYCTTILRENGSATCVCEVVGLFGVQPYPTILNLVENRFEVWMDLGIPTVGTTPVWIIFGIVLFLYKIGWKDANKSDEYNGDTWKTNLLKANKIILGEIGAFVYLNKLSIKWDAKAFEKLKKQLEKKMKRLCNAQDLSILLGDENLGDCIENCIDNQNFDDLKRLISNLLNQCDEFKAEVKTLKTEYNFMNKVLDIDEIYDWWRARPVLKRMKNTINLDTDSNIALWNSVDKLKPYIIKYIKDHHIEEICSYEKQNTPASVSVEAINITINNNEECNEQSINLQFDSQNTQENSFESTTFLSRSLEILQTKAINSKNYKKNYFGYFIKHNDILGVIGYTDLNSPRRFRLTYLILAICTEITIAISAFDNYNRQIDREVWLLFYFQQQSFWIFVLSIGFGILPLFTKLYFNYNVLSSQFEKHKLLKCKNKSVFIGYIVSWLMILGEFVYCLFKLRLCPLTNFHAYMSYIAQSLIFFLISSGIGFPLAISAIHCCCFENSCKNKNKVIQDTQYIA